MGEIQREIDVFLRESNLRSVSDIIYIPDERVAVVIRRVGHKNVTIDLSDVDREDIVGTIGRCKAVY